MGMDQRLDNMSEVYRIWKNRIKNYQNSCNSRKLTMRKYSAKTKRKNN